MTKSTLLFLSTIVAGIFFATQLPAQMGYAVPGDIMELHDQTILVGEIPFDEERYQKKAKKKPGEAKLYKKNAEEVAENWRKAVESTWHYGTPKMAPLGDLASACHNGTGEGAYLVWNPYPPYFMDPSMMKNGPFANYRRPYKEGEGWTVVELYRDNDDHKSIWYAGLKENKPSEADFVSALTFLQAYMQLREQDLGKKELEAEARKKGKIILPNRTLLIPKESLAGGLSLNDVKKYYPGKAKIATQQEIDNAILTKDERYAYVFVTPLGSTTAGNTSSPNASTITALYYGQYILDCSSGLMLGIAFRRPLAPGTTANRKIKKFHLKKFAESL